MPSITVTGTLLNMFTDDGFTDRETGQITFPSPKIQILEQDTTRKGERRLYLRDFKVEPDTASAYAKLLTKVVTVTVKTYTAKNGKIDYYIPKGSPPPQI